MWGLLLKWKSGDAWFGRSGIPHCYDRISLLEHTQLPLKLQAIRLHMPTPRRLSYPEYHELNPPEVLPTLRFDGSRFHNELRFAPHIHAETAPADQASGR